MFIKVDSCLKILCSELSRGKSYAELENSFRDVVSVCPDSLISHYYLSLICIERFSWQEAIDELSKIIKILANKNLDEDLSDEICRVRLLRAKVYLYLSEYFLAEVDLNWLINQQNYTQDRELLKEISNTKALLEKFRSKTEINNKLLSIFADFFQLKPI
jgi:tetratricopeptide (TPR) repeat protein